MNEYKLSQLEINYSFTGVEGFTACHIYNDSVNTTAVGCGYIFYKHKIVDAR